MRTERQFRLPVLTTYLLLGFPIFYFVYKFGVLLEGYDDARWYLKLAENLSSTEVPSPFNMRLLSTSIVHLMTKAGLMYETQCAIDAYTVSKPYFFNMILFNYIAIVLTAYSFYNVFGRLAFP